METKHTKGEWIFEKESQIYSNGIGIFIKSRKDNSTICHMACESDLDVANAKLISAAPELLEALEYALEFLPKDVQRKAKQAINKATK